MKFGIDAVTMEQVHEVGHDDAFNHGPVHMHNYTVLGAYFR
jgi:hypothetical protein